MIPASAEFQAYEAMRIGASPAVRASFLPYAWPNGVNADGDFVHCAFAAPDRIQADYQGFVGGSWVSPVITSNLQVPISPAELAWGWNSPGFDLLLYWRGAGNLTDLAAASWTLVNQGDTIQIQPFYQFKLTLEGYRVWAVDVLGDADDFTAHAEDSPGSLDAYQGYAADANVSNDPLTYIEALRLIGEFTVTRDIEQAGTVGTEAPKAFDDLVAGSISLLLNNRQGAFVGTGGGWGEGGWGLEGWGEEGEEGGVALTWIPAPLFSPNKSSFFLAGQDWYNLQLRISLGYSQGGFLDAPFLESPLFEEDYTEFLTLFLGRVKKWGPVSRAVDQDGAAQPNTVEVYAVDYIADCLQKRIALPDADGTPRPLTYGEYLCKAENVIGWTPADPVKVANLERGDLTEFDGGLESGGGAVSITSPGLSESEYAMRCTVNGVSQAAYKVLSLDAPGTIFATGILRFTSIPGILHDKNLVFLEVIDYSGNSLIRYESDDAGLIWAMPYGATTRVEGYKTTLTIMQFLNVPLNFALWYYPGPGANNYALWINGDMVHSSSVNIWPTETSIAVRFGIGLTETADNLIVDFDDLKLYDTYYHNAYKVEGGPFDDIKEVYIDNVAQPDTKDIRTPDDVDNFQQTVTRYPEFGMVVIEGTYNGNSVPENWLKISDVMIKVVEHAGGRHALYIIEDLLAKAGLTSNINAVALVAAYAAVPDDIINARFEGGGERNPIVIKDVASLGMTIADALKEIFVRCLYWMFQDADQIKILPYTGTPPASPVLPLGPSNLYECAQTIDLESINAFVSFTYGWYEHDPSLFYATGDQSAGGQGTGLDCTWSSPVAFDTRTLAKAKAILLLQFLSAQERLEPVRLNLSGARLELMDVVSVSDVLLNDSPDNYFVTRKEVGLDPGSRETNLQLMRFLGE